MSSPANVPLNPRTQMAEIVERSGARRLIPPVKVALGAPGTDRGNLGDPTKPLNTENQAYDSVVTGEVALQSGQATQLPTVACKLVRIQARSGNTTGQTVAIGTSSSVTVPAGTTNATAGFELAPGIDTGWIPVSNLNKLWGKAQTTGDSVVYMCLVG